jgi:hypothetical protein
MLLDPFLSSRDLLALVYSFGSSNSYCYFNREYDPIDALGGGSEGHSIDVIVAQNDARQISQDSTIEVSGQGSFSVIEKEPMGDGQYWKLKLIEA